MLGKASIVLIASLGSSPFGQVASKDDRKDVDYELIKVAPTKADLAKGVLRVKIDYSEVPQLKEWAEKAQALAETWHPKISDMLKTDGFTPPSDVTLIFKKDMKGVAFASGKTITIAGDWVTKNPGDFGMVVHELTHVVQSYRGAPREAGWLVEGIADYVRFYKYEPLAKIGRIDPKRASYKDSYRTSAQFVNWIEKTHDKEIVAKLNRALREREYQPALFQRWTGKSVDDLWTDFVATLTK